MLACRFDSVPVQLIERKKILVARVLRVNTSLPEKRDHTIQDSTSGIALPYGVGDICHSSPLSGRTNTERLLSMLLSAKAARNNETIAASTKMSDLSNCRSHLWRGELRLDSLSWSVSFTLKIWKSNRLKQLLTLHGEACPTRTFSQQATPCQAWTSWALDRGR